MKYFKWKIFLITSIIILLPITFGVAVWDRLPDRMAIHFNFYGIPDNYAKKEFAVFFLPVFMVVIQGVCCFAADFNLHKHKTKLMGKWLIPFITVVLYIITIGFSLGWNIDITGVSTVLIGIIFIAAGVFLPETDGKTSCKFIKRMTMILGIVFLIGTIILPGQSFFCLLLLIPYAIICVLHGLIKRGK